MKNFTGKNAFITGAASGIGLGLAQTFAAQGINVVLADVDFDKLASAGVPLINDHDDAFSYQLMLGVAYEFSPAWAINVGYRFYATDNLNYTGTAGVPVSSGGTKVHNADLGVRFNF